MKNCILNANVRPGQWWRLLRIYFTDNGNGTWNVDGKGLDGYPINKDMTAEEAQNVIDSIKAAYDKSVDPDNFKAFSIEDITADTVDRLMKGYDHYTWAIDSLRQQEAAEANNRWILQMCDRIRKALNLELATA